MPAYIAWKPFYTVSDPSLDAEHKQIIESINELYAALDAENAIAATRRTMDKMVQYTRTHFAHEEKILTEADYPDLQAHKKLHDDMRRRTIALRSHLDLMTARDVLVMLKDWWLGHIQGEDKKYAAYLQAVAVK